MAGSFVSTLVLTDIDNGSEFLNEVLVASPAREHAVRYLVAIAVSCRRAPRSMFGMA